MHDEPTTMGGDGNWRAQRINLPPLPVVSKRRKVFERVVMILVTLILPWAMVVAVVVAALWGKTA